MKLERYHGGRGMTCSPDGAWTPYAEAQAAIDALQARLKRVIGLLVTAPVDGERMPGHKEYWSAEVKRELGVAP